MTYKCIAADLPRRITALTMPPAAGLVSEICTMVADVIRAIVA
ncbi:MAG TPA: hypothetical protein VHZ31_06100 [Solirubrobacteraceae bacterium]|jgi:hypothetical protein|nr:hypothetical protein [Solirubrobacteraceae bacterium]